MTMQVEPGSFRDPCGFLFRNDGVLLRQVNTSYRNDYELLLSSGLYQQLVKEHRLVVHKERELSLSLDKQAYKIIEPELVPFISYPYEWSFSAWQDAALLTLTLQKSALAHGMTLKDASAYNVQFVRGKPIFIDTLSFQKHEEGTPWIAYRQFCQHFLAPLLLMSLVDIRLGGLLRQSIDGIPLDLASRLLPFSTWFRFSVLSHIHLHAKSQQKYASNQAATQQVQKRKMSRLALLGLIDNLESLVKSLVWRSGQTEWGDYYDKTNYTESSKQSKHALVQSYLEQIKPARVWDLGANDGTYSRLALSVGADVVSWDIDPVAVEKNYLHLRKESASLLPLQLDLTNPSPAIGWANEERSSFLQRGPVDLTMGLALIHHLAISNHVPLARIASFFAQCGDYAIIEFVPKEDSQVRRLLATREDTFPHYHLDGFQKALSSKFEVLRKDEVEGTARTLFLLKKKPCATAL